MRRTMSGMLCPMLVIAGNYIIVLKMALDRGMIGWRDRDFEDDT
jgi:hypothetical protein